MSFDLKISNGSFIFSDDGTLKKVFNEDKLRQDVIKIILTPQGTLKLHPWYGSPINERAIGKVLPANLLDTEMSSSILFAINNLIKLQGLQIKDGQYTTPNELIGQVLNISVERSIYESRQYNIVIDILTKRGTTIRENFALTS